MPMLYLGHRGRPLSTSDDRAATVSHRDVLQLGAEALGELHGQGYLQAVYMVIASLSNFRALIERAGRLDAAQR